MESSLRVSSVVTGVWLTLQVSFSLPLLIQLTLFVKNVESKNTCSLIIVTVIIKLGFSNCLLNCNLTANTLYLKLLALIGT